MTDPYITHKTFSGDQAFRQPHGFTKFDTIVETQSNWQYYLDNELQAIIFKTEKL